MLTMQFWVVSGWIFKDTSREEISEPDWKFNRRLKLRGA
jgi:hypothetical protein